MGPRLQEAKKPMATKEESSPPTPPCSSPLKMVMPHQQNLKAETEKPNFMVAQHCIIRELFHLEPKSLLYNDQSFRTNCIVVSYNSLCLLNLSTLYHNLHSRKIALRSQCNVTKSDTCSCSETSSKNNSSLFNIPSNTHNFTGKILSFQKKKKEKKNEGISIDLIANEN